MHHKNPFFIIVLLIVVAFVGYIAYVRVKPTPEVTVRKISRRQCKSNQGVGNGTIHSRMVSIRD